MGLLGGGLGVVIAGVGEQGRQSRGGGNAAQELAECAGAIRKLGLSLEAVHHFPIDGADHAVIVLRKVAPTPKQYPRRFSKIKQAPL